MAHDYFRLGLLQERMVQLQSRFNQVYFPILLQIFELRASESNDADCEKTTLWNDVLQIMTAWETRQYNTVIDIAALQVFPQDAFTEYK